MTLLAESAWTIPPYSRGNRDWYLGAALWISYRADRGWLRFEMDGDAKYVDITRAEARTELQRAGILDADGRATP